MSELMNILNRTSLVEKFSKKQRHITPIALLHTCGKVKEILSERSYVEKVA